MCNCVWVGIAQSVEWLEGPGIEYPWGTRFPVTVQTSPGAHPSFNTMSTVSFPGVKRLEQDVDHPTHTAPKLKKQYSYTSTTRLGLLGLYVIRWALPLPFTVSNYNITMSFTGIMHNSVGIWGLSAEIMPKFKTARFLREFFKRFLLPQRK